MPFSPATAPGLSRLKKGAKDKDALKLVEIERAALDKVMEALGNEKPARAVQLTPEERETVRLCRR